MTDRRRALVLGAMVVAVYIAGAAWSGHLSPAARRPILDGLAPPTPYRWVDPPPELATENVLPTPGSVVAELGPGGIDTTVFTTPDAQVSVLLPEGSIRPSRGGTTVEVTAEPLDPATLEAPPEPLRIAGNVIEVRAAYEPSGDAVTELAEPYQVVLIYPLLPNDHGGHVVITSPDGETWTEAETNDLPSVQQADATVDAFGYVAVARTRPASPTGGADGGPDTTSSLVAAGVAVVAVLLGGFWWIRRGERRAS